MMSPEFQEQLDSFNSIGDQLCKQLIDYLAKLGLQTQTLPEITISDLSCSEQSDPYSGDVSLQGEWRNKSGILCGSVTYRGDGSLYVEHDVLMPHPKDESQIIEAITAWGTIDKLKLEPRMMAALGV